MAKTVTITLAYPLTAEQSKRLAPKEVKDYQVGDKITVRWDYARTIINAGFAAGVDPDDAETVQATMDGNQPAYEGDEAPASSRKSSAAKSDSKGE